MSAIHHSRVRTARSWLLAFELLAILAAASAIAGGDLDPGFGRDGRLNLNLDAGLGLSIGWDRGRGFVRQPGDGKLLMGASVYLSPGRGTAWVVVRMNADGSLDRSFGTSGLVTLDRSPAFEDAVDLALQPDGKIVVAGHAFEDGRTRLTLTRLNADGSLDPSFNGDGQAKIDAGGTIGDFAAAVAIAPDGRIVIVGATRRNDQFDLVFARLLQNGALDTSFGTGPLPGTTVVDSGMSDEPAALLRQPDGKWLACGKRRNENAKDEDAEALGMLVVRLEASGAVDKTFGNGGVWQLSNADGRGAARDCTLLADGRILLAGYIGPLAARSPALVMLRPDGILDPGFGIRSIVHDGRAEFHALLPPADGKLMLAGTATPRRFEGLYEMIVARVDAATGRLDAGFGQGGITSIDFGQSRYAGMGGANALLRQPDGSITVMGHVGFNDDPWYSWDATSSVGLARIAPDGYGSKGVLGFAIAPFDIKEGSGAARVAVRRTGGSAGPVSVDFETLTGTATSPGEFSAVRGSLSWADGEVEPKFISVPLTDDAIAEPDRSFSLRLTNATAPLGWEEQRITIVDDDARNPSQSGSGGSSVVPATSNGGSGGGSLGASALLWLLAAVATRARRRTGPS